MSNITGGCHCGAIRYQVEGELIVHSLCHCSDCRRHAGAPVVGWTMYAEDAVKVTKGQPKVYELIGAWQAALLRRLRHGALLHQCEQPARDHRYSERDLRRPQCRPGDGAYPDRRAAALDGARTRTADLRALSAADLAAQPLPQEKTIRQRPRSDSPVLRQPRRNEKPSRRARTARDFSHRGEGGMLPSNFRICHAHMDEVPRSKGYSL